MSTGDRYTVRLKDALMYSPAMNNAYPERADGGALAPMSHDLLVEVLETSDGLIVCPGPGLSESGSSAAPQEESSLSSAGTEVLLRRLTALEKDLSRKDKDLKMARIRNNDLMRKNEKLSDRLLKYVDKVLGEKEEAESS